MQLIELWLENFIPFVTLFAVGLTRSKALGVIFVLILGISLLGNTAFSDNPDWAYAAWFIVWGGIGFCLGWWLRIIWQKRHSKG